MSQCDMPQLIAKSELGIMDREWVRVSVSSILLSYQQKLKSTVDIREYLIRIFQFQIPIRILKFIVLTGKLKFHFSIKVSNPKF